MKYAMGITIAMVGSILIYSGFKDVAIWDTTLSVIHGK